jgi:Fic family protein
MTVITKVVKGNPYYYYQDNVKDSSNNNKIKTISTLIGRTDLNDETLLSKRAIALEKHFIKVFKEISLITHINYKFENKPTNTSLDGLEIIKIKYNQYMGHLLPDERENYNYTFFIKYVHGTTAIEGNTLSEDEAGKLLSMGLTSNNKPHNENIEVENYNDVRKFMETYPNHEDVNEKLIKHINKLLMKGVKVDGIPVNAGEYRVRGAKITGIWFKPPAAELISQRVRYALADYHDGQKRNIHPVELASIFHQKFEEIHPFQEGNGRTGREILNYMLKRNGFPPINITPKQRSEYLNALEEGNKSNYVPLIDFIIGRMNATLLYLVSRTSILKIIKTEGYKKFFINIGDEIMYNKFVEETEHLNKSEEFP